MAARARKARMVFIPSSPIVSLLAGFDHLIMATAEMLQDRLLRLMPNGVVSLQALALQFPQRGSAPEWMIVTKVASRARLGNRKRSKAVGPFKADRLYTDLDQIFSASEAIDENGISIFVRERELIVAHSCGPLRSKLFVRSIERIQIDFPRYSRVAAALRVLPEKELFPDQAGPFGSCTILS